MEIRTLNYPGTDLVANTHLLFLDERNVIAFDMGQVNNSFINYLARNNLHLIAVFLTHGHFDHIQGLDYLDEEVEVFIHDCDYELLSDEYKNCSNGLKEPVIINHQVKTLKEYDEITFSDVKIKIFNTPFHTMGSSLYLLENKDFKALITGDTLFKSVIGRCDLPTSSKRLVNSSLKKILDIYNQYGDMPIYPGHGENSTLKREVEKNIYLRNINR